MKELVFLLEERSAKALLDAMLPRLLDPRIVHRTIAFEGKQDLEKQLVRKLRGYQNPNARFIVMRDLDSAPDCALVKRRLLDLCSMAGKDAVSLVRIACRELEAMYLADLRAVEAALGQTGLAVLQNVKNFRSPDRLGSPSVELSRLTGGAYQKTSSSRQLGLHLDLDNDRSPSFRHLVLGIRKMQTSLLAS